MTRWEPNAHARLQQAALELYGERGFEQTTVADIATRAGLTERTFFRYFADKREVLFRGSEWLQQGLVDALAILPEGALPLDAVASALEGLSPSFEGRRELSRQRYAIISAHAELQERELIKLASLASAVTAALRRRGVREPAASLTAEAGVAILKVAFERWVNDANAKSKTKPKPKGKAGAQPRDLAHYIRESLGELKGVAAGKVVVRAGPPAARAKTASARRPSKKP